MKFIKEYLKEVLHIQPLGALTIEATNDINGTFLSGEEIIIDGFSSGLCVAHIDYANWLEKKVIANDVIDTTPQEDKYVDLGLPSGKLWAKCNIGATSETESGLYFQWGETEGRTAEEIANKPCIWGTTPFNIGSEEYNEACFNLFKDEVCPNGVLEYRFDAVYQHTKGKAHMPTKEDFEELIANTNSSWETNFNGSGMSGRKFTSKKDVSKYIFIPAAGYITHHWVGGETFGSDLWSSSLCLACSRYALQAEMNYRKAIMVNTERFVAHPIRGIMN